MLSASTLIAGFWSLAIVSHGVYLIYDDAKPGEKIDIHGSPHQDLVVFIEGVLETKMNFNLS